MLVEDADCHWKIDKMSADEYTWVRMHKVLVRYVVWSLINKR